VLPGAAVEEEPRLKRIARSSTLVRANSQSNGTNWRCRCLSLHPVLTQPQNFAHTANEIAAGERSGRRHVCRLVGELP
jgi:hypothetical protein